MEVDVQSILFQHPCNIFITGPSGCGKTEFVHKLIDYRKDLFNIEPERVVCYKEWQQTYSLMQEKFNSQFELIKFVEEIPMDENEIVSDVSIPHLIVFDDMLGEKDEEKIKLWFTKKDIIVMQVLYTSHKICFNNPNQVVLSVLIPDI